MKHICTAMHYRLEVGLRTLVISGAPRASEATYLRKFGNLSTPEIFCNHVTVRQSVRTTRKPMCNVKPSI